jgi:hypothetical protein
LSGRAGVADLVRRSVRWRVSVRWYLIALLPVPVGATLISLAIYGPGALAAPAGGWPRALAEVAAVFVLQLVLFQLAEKIGFTGFLQHHWQDRYNPLKLTLYVALLWAVWHVPDHFAEEGWGMEALISAPVVFAIGFVSLFFARALFVWFYNRTLSRRRATYHASLGRFRRTRTRREFCVSEVGLRRSAQRPAGGRMEARPRGSSRNSHALPSRRSVSAAQPG